MLTTVLEFGDVRERDLLTVAFTKVIYGVVAVWVVLCGISSEHRTQLHIFNAIVNANEYHNVLQTHVVPFFQNHPRMPTLQQDNARPHIARVNIQYIQQQNVNIILQRPASSTRVIPRNATHARSPVYRPGGHCGDL